MMRRSIGLLLLVFALAACANENSEPEQESTSATLPPTSIITDYTGPILNSSSSSGGSSNESCGEPDPNNPNAGCVAHTTQNTSSSAPLPLTERTIAGLTIGVPEGFELLDLGNRWLISALDAEATLGEFTVTIRQVPTAEIENILGEIADLDQSEKIDHQNPDSGLNGYSIPYGERGEIGVFEMESGQQIVINGFAAPGAWPNYSATFEQMLASLSFATE
jgi:hypothetical protein